MPKRGGLKPPAASFAYAAIASLMMACGNTESPMRHAYPAQSIQQIRTKDGKTEPKAPAGMAVPVGWRLTDDGEGYEKEREQRQ